MRRSGLTLTEVLIAIFVMGIGLMSVMSLFPVGALTMARAIKDDRAGHAAANARAIAIAKNIRFDPEAAQYFDNPDPALFEKAPPNGPSYPQFVDPRGYLNYSLPGRDWVANINSMGMRRRKLSFVADNVGGLKWCTLLDDVVFGPNGGPSQEFGLEVQRGASVSWAWMLRRPKASVPSFCEVTVVIYNQRPFVPGLGAKELKYAGVLSDPNMPKLVTLTWPGGVPAPPITSGDWILDATPPIDISSGAKGRPGNAKFHRVLSVGDEVAQTLEIELETPLQLPLGVTLPSHPRTIVILEGVVEVVECGPGWNAGGS